MNARIIACVALVALAAGCSRVTSEVGPGARHVWTQAGVLRVTVPNDPRNLNPLLATTTIDVFIDRFMFEPLVSADPHGNPVPMLAVAVPSLASGGIAKNGLTITYHLRKGVKWTDGVPVTSADVKWSWLAIMNPENNIISRHGYDDVQNIETPDNATAVVHLKNPFAPFVNTFFAESDQPYGVLPAHVLAQYRNINQLSFNNAPTVSDGPYRFVSWQHGERITFAANDGFFLGKPGLREVQVRVVPDETTSVTLLRTHAIDYIYQASINTYPALKDMSGIKIVWLDMNGYESLQLNLSHPSLASPNVRRAIAYALDKARIVGGLTHGQDKVATEDLPDWMWAHDKNVKPQAYDPATARGLLRGDGWAPGADGVLRKNGQPLRLVLVADNADATHREEAPLVQEALRQIGIDVEVKFYPLDILYAPAEAGGVVHGGHYDLALFRWYAGIDPDDSSQFLCANVPPVGYNDARYCNPDMEAAQATALTHYDQPARQAAYFKVQELLARDDPSIFLWWQRQQEPISVDFKGFAPNPVVESWNAWQWSI